MTFRKPAALYVTVVVFVGLVVAIYVLSIGPAYWLLSHYETPDGWGAAYSFLYWPILWAEENGPPAVQNLIDWYVYGCWS